ARLADLIRMLRTAATVEDVSTLGHVYPGLMLADRCGPGEGDITDGNTDEWSSRQQQAVQALAAIEAEDMFISAEECFEYASRSEAGCSRICREECGAEAGHCQRDLGMCVCHNPDGSRTTTTHSCTGPITEEDAQRIVACCLDAHGGVAAVPPVLGGEGSCTSPDVPGLTFDLCSDDSGYICCLPGGLEEEVRADDTCTMECGPMCALIHPNDEDARIACVGACSTAAGCEDRDGDTCVVGASEGTCCGGSCVAGASGCDPGSGTGCAGSGDGEACTSALGVCCGGSCALDATDCGSLGTCNEMCRTLVAIDQVSACTRACVEMDVSCEAECGVFPDPGPCLRKCGNGADEDGDDRVDEDPVDGRDNDGDGRMDEDGAGESVPPSLVTCQRGCLDGDDAERCLRECKLSMPRVDVRLAILRGLAEQRTFYHGERVRLSLEVRNSGFRSFAGAADLSLHLLPSCSCPECPQGFVCPCSCTEDRRFAGSLSSIVLPPGSDYRALTGEIALNGDLTVTAVQPGAVLRRAGGKVVLDARGPISFMVVPDMLTVADAYFLRDGERATDGYTGEQVTGAVTVTAHTFPMTVEVFLADAQNKVVEGSAKVHDVTGPVQELEITTEELALSNEMANAVFSIGVEVRDGDGAVVERQVLPGQGYATSRCKGRVMNTWCEGERARVRLGYPDASLEVRPLELEITAAAFTDVANNPLDEMYTAGEARATLTVRNTVPKSFVGTVLVRAVSKEGLVVSGSEERRTVALGRGDTSELVGQMFPTTMGESYRLWVVAEHQDGTVWTDALVPSNVFVYAALGVLDPDATEGERTDIYTTVSQDPCSVSIYCSDCLVGCELRVDRERCTVSKRFCACECSSLPL
ncbi:MAG: hypothetical protein QGG50_01445, partial [Methanopyri archaeon]|nr:hypothetical protein [Methanopyri archaeon]